MNSSTSSGDSAARRGGCNPLFDVLDLAHLSTGPDLAITNVSAAFEKLSAQAEADLIGKCLTHVLCFDDADEAAIRRLMHQPGGAIDTPCSLQTPSGLKRQLTLRVAAVFGGEIGLEIVAQDVTFWEEERARLREEARRCRTISDLTSDCAYAIRVLPGGRLQHDWVLGAFSDITGFTLAELRDQGGWATLIHPDDHRITERQLQKVLAGQDTVATYRIWSKSGGIRWVRDVARSVRSSLEGPVIRIEGALQDVTDQHELEQQLTASRDRYRALFESVNAAIFIADASTGIILDVNNDAERLVGRSRDELIGSHQSELHPPNQGDHYRDMFRQHVFTERASSVEAEVMHASGIRIPVAIFGSRSEVEGRVWQIGVFHDLTEHRRAENAAREQDALNRAIIEHAAEAIGVFFGKGDRIEFVLWNDRMVELTGYERDAVNEIGWFAALWPEDSMRQRGEARFARLLAGEELRAEVWEIVRKGGELRQVSMSVSRLDERNDGRVLVLIRDVTDRERHLERRRHSEKMEAIGQLAGGVAHDFNNQLTGIMGLAELLARELEGRPAERARQISAICDRTRDLTQQLLAFARRGRSRTMVVDMREVVREAVSLLAHTIDKRIELTTTTCDAGAMVRGDPALLQNAILNIALNARDAMPAGGKISFGVEVFDTGSDVVVSIADTGTGMSEETRRRLFEPFFTTKPRGRGTGMGLATAYDTVNDHGGRIEVDSVLGRGSVFRVFLPCAKDSQPDEIGATAAMESPSRRATILLADDEPSVRNTMTDMLRILGHTVLACADGDEALQVIRDRFEDIDLVVLDIVMPRRAGRDVLRDMRVIDPDARVLLISGYAADVDTREDVSLGAAGFLQKPFSIETLSGLVDEMLSKDKQGRRSH